MSDAERSFFGLKGVLGPHRSNRSRGSSTLKRRDRSDLGQLTKARMKGLELLGRCMDAIYMQGSASSALE